MTTKPVTWLETEPNVYVLLHRKRVFQVDMSGAAARNGLDWRASWRDAGAPASELREFEAHATRLAAMAWCWNKIEPDADPADVVHLIGEAAR